MKILWKNCIFILFLILPFENLLRKIEPSEITRFLYNFFGLGGFHPFPPLATPLFRREIWDWTFKIYRTLAKQSILAFISRVMGVVTLAHEILDGLSEYARNVDFFKRFALPIVIYSAKWNSKYPSNSLKPIIYKLTFYLLILETLWENSKDMHYFFHWEKIHSRSGKCSHFLTIYFGRCESF